MGGWERVEAGQMNEWTLRPSENQTKGLSQGKHSLEAVGCELGGAIGQAGALPKSQAGT